MVEKNSPPLPDNVSHEGYGYGNPHAYQHYSGYYGGYYGTGGGGGNADGPPARTIQDYMLMIRERFWYLILTIFVCTASVLIYVANSPDEWMAAAQLRVYRKPYEAPAPSLAGSNSYSPNIVSSTEDFMTQVEVMKSGRIVEKVSRRLTQAQRKDVLEPYQAGNIFTGPLRESDVLIKCRDIIPKKQTLIAYVTYTHQNKDLAKLLAQYFAEEVRAANEETRQNIVAPMLEQSLIQLRNLDQEIDTLYAQRREMIDTTPKLLGLTSEMSTARAELTNLEMTRNADRKTFEEAEGLWKQLNKLKSEGRPITELAAVANMERVMSMETQVSHKEIAISGMRERYNDSHPQMVMALRELEQAKTERAAAIAAAEAKIQQNYQATQNNFAFSEQRVKEKEAQILALNGLHNKLEGLDRKIRERESMRNIMYQSYVTEKQKLEGSVTPSIDIIEEAQVTSNVPINKNYLKYGAIGFLGGTVLGCAIIFILAFLDDRVKSSSDIERFLALPLIGILPIARRLNSFKKARVVATGEDRPVTEAFRAIFSALKINEVARTAKTFLTTSTTPSEGKSFVTTNLAMTYAMHGEKVLIIDADLRMPAVGKTLQLEGDRGITRYLQGAATLEESIHYGVVPNLDVLAVGAPCKNPTQILNSKQFGDMISTLKERYDRIFVDSPPVGAVSDSLNLLPQVDGILYVVRFNTVKRRFIKSNVRRLQESKVPIFGAILNQIGLRVARYYTNTGDRSYTKYYTSENKLAEEVTLKA